MITKTGEQPVEVKGDSLLATAKRLAGKIKDAVTGEDTDTGVFHDFVYEESGVEGATFELYLLLAEIQICSSKYIRKNIL